MIAMGGSIVLLLAGTEILDWYWIALLAAASLGAGAYRLRKKIPSTYELARRIDRRLKLADTLSTATYFASPEARADEAVCRRQRRDAEELARSVDVRQAVPFTRSRYTYPAIGFAMVAFGLFAVRYAVTRSLSLEPSLVRIAYDTFFGSDTQLAKAQREKQSGGEKQPQLDPGSPDAPDQSDMAPDAVLDSVDTPDVNNPDAANQSKSDSAGQPPDPKGEEQGESTNKDDRSNGNDASNQDNPQNDGATNAKQQNGKQDSKQGAGSENSSLLEKLKDAMANMLNKMRMPQRDGQQSAQNAKDGKQGGRRDKSNQKGTSSQSRSQASDADSQSDQQQSDGDKKQSAESRSSEKSSDKSPSQDSKSGIGSQDGDKAAREAEQLAAMGKISEILGKRSANVTGEVMVEVGSGKQQLKTPWAQRQATHAEAGSEIHRDEVPLMYQQFVQQYFEEIRKTPPASKNPSKQ
jgi:hypothetical protein